VTPSRKRGIRLIALATSFLVLGCGRESSVEDAPRALPVDVYADTGRTFALRAVAPPVPAAEARGSAWLARVSPSRVAIPDVPQVDPGTETLTVVAPEPPALVVEEGLKPPLPRTRAPLAVPPGARGSVELDVRVDEGGMVSDAVWADGTRDPAMVRAALECARAMRFYPAQRAGRPVAVWCRERFDFGGPGP
jgi:TonB family protein